MQTAIHPQAPKAIKIQNKSESDSITLVPVYRKIDIYLNCLINLILTHRSNPTLSPREVGFFYG